MTNFFPSYEDIMGKKDSTPICILKSQMENLKEIDMFLKPALYIDQFYQGNEALEFISSKKKELSTDDPIPEIVGDDAQVVAIFTISRTGIKYTAEILRLKHSVLSGFPVKVYDNCRQMYFEASSKEDYESTLRDIFNSKEFKRIIMYIISGPIA